MFNENIELSDDFVSVIVYACRLHNFISMQLQLHLQQKIKKNKEASDERWFHLLSMHFLVVDLVTFPFHWIGKQ